MNLLVTFLKIALLLIGRVIWESKDEMKIFYCVCNFLIIGDE